MTKHFTHVKRKLKYEDLVVENSTVNGRTYLTPIGSRYPSITTVLGILSEESIRKWRERVGAEEANRISRKASSRGTKLHLVAEKYIDNDSTYLDKQMPHVIELFNSIKPILDSRVDNVYAQEIALYSDHFKIAGRADCIAELDGELMIIDYKTSSKPKEKDWISSYFIQAAFYAAAYFEATNIPIKKSAIIIAVEGSEPQVFIEETFPWFKKLLEVRNEYRLRKGI